MTLITQTQVIDAPVDRVFKAVIDAGNYAAWNPTIRAALEATVFSSPCRARVPESTTNSR
jgi:hypothetical protein